MTSSTKRSIGSFFLFSSILLTLLTDSVCFINSFPQTNEGIISSKNENEGNVLLSLNDKYVLMDPSEFQGDDYIILDTNGDHQDELMNITFDPDSMEINLVIFSFLNEKEFVAKNLSIMSPPLDYLCFSTGNFDDLYEDELVLVGMCGNVLDVIIYDFLNSSSTSYQMNTSSYVFDVICANVMGDDKDEVIVLSYNYLKNHSSLFVICINNTAFINYNFDLIEDNYIWVRIQEGNTSLVDTYDDLILYADNFYHNESFFKIIRFLNINQYTYSFVRQPEFSNFVDFGCFDFNNDGRDEIIVLSWKNLSNPLFSSSYNIIQIYSLTSSSLVLENIFLYNGSWFFKILLVGKLMSDMVENKVYFIDDDWWEISVDVGTLISGYASPYTPTLDYLILYSEFGGTDLQWPIYIQTVADRFWNDYSIKLNFNMVWPVWNNLEYLDPFWLGISVLGDVSEPYEMIEASLSSYIEPGEILLVFYYKYTIATLTDAMGGSYSTGIGNKKRGLAVINLGGDNINLNPGVFTLDERRRNAITHEFGHVFGIAGHCTHWNVNLGNCIMHSTGFYSNNVFLGTCHETVLNARNALWYGVKQSTTPPISPGTPGSHNAIPIWDDIAFIIAGLFVISLYLKRRKQKES
ncbi:MAG: hypothetical protein Q6373_021590 [Candidatus Sigynarchaeota archaeon]